MRAARAVRATAGAALLSALVHLQVLLILLSTRRRAIGREARHNVLMLMPYAPSAAPLTRLADGTVKQISPFTGTEVWTVPGRGNRPISHPVAEVHRLAHDERTSACAFCSDRYLETPPEKSRIVRRPTPEGEPGVHAPEAPASPGEDLDQPAFERIDAVAASALFDTVAEFRRIPNLFEIVSFDYWRANHGYELPDGARARLDAYLADPAGAEHAAAVARAKMRASGTDPGAWDTMNTTARRAFLAPFFAGGHDVIVARRHFTDDAVDS